MAGLLSQQIRSGLRGLSENPCPHPLGQFVGQQPRQLQQVADCQVRPRLGHSRKEAAKQRLEAVVGAFAVYVRHGAGEVSSEHPQTAVVLGVRADLVAEQLDPLSGILLRGAVFDVSKKRDGPGGL